MNPLTLMFIAGEPSGDMLAAELVEALRKQSALPGEDSSPDLLPRRGPFAPRFIGAGGPRMIRAGVELACDMTEHSVVGLWEVVKDILQFKRLLNQLLQVALKAQPDAIICVDFSGFNRRFAHALRRRVRSRRGSFNNWNPKIIQYVSPQVWASRPSRAQAMAKDFDLLLSIFPFEAEWYAQRVPHLRVEFVGHPLFDRYGMAGAPNWKAEKPVAGVPLVALLPGSRMGELRRHLPVMLPAARLLTAQRQCRFRMIVPGDSLLLEVSRQLCRASGAGALSPAGSTLTIDDVRAAAERFLPGLEVELEGLADTLREADLAIASTGTVTLECAYFGVPTATLYRTSWGTYQIAKRLVQVQSIAMPNLLAGEVIYPEFVQDAATPEAIAREALELLNNGPRRDVIRAKLRQVIASLGGRAASHSAACVIRSLLLPDTSQGR